MKHVFLVILGLLVVATVGTVWLTPELHSDVPVLYWVTDANPAREEQIVLFHRWLKKNHYPLCQLRLDTANRDVSKMIIQGVSGVAGDIMDINGGLGMRYFHAVGLLTDVTDWARELGFDTSKTYAAIASEITLDGRQYMFPCNVFADLYWVNKATLARYGLEPPPRRMDFDAFERLGQRFVAAANPPGTRHRVFFCDGVDVAVLRRSVGVSLFNETLTRCILDRAQSVRVLELVHKWRYEDHLFPTPAEQASFSTEAGYGGATLQLFNSGFYAMFRLGRYALIQLRQFGSLDLGVCEPPNGGFPNTRTGTRAAAVYINTRYPDYAKYFLAYLASEDYNMQIVRDADALPPNPIYTRTEAFRRPLPVLPELRDLFPYADDEMDEVGRFKRSFYAVTDRLDREQMLAAQARGELDAFVSQLPAPPRPRCMSPADYQQQLARFYAAYAALIPQYQKEWGCHEAFARAAEEIAIGADYSPFIVPSSASRIEAEMMDGFYAGLYSAETACRRAARRINEEMERSLKENPKLQPLYDELTTLQKKIDARRAAGGKVPLAWIKNPFYRRYYVHQGWAE